MAERVTTREDAEATIARWNIGIGPDQLHDALGWTPAELERYQAEGWIPAAPENGWATTKDRVNEVLAPIAENLPPAGSGIDHTAAPDGPFRATVPDNPFLAGVACPDVPPHEQPEQPARRKRMRPSDDLQTYTWLRETAHRYALFDQDAGGESNAFAEWYVAPIPDWDDERPVDMAIAFRKWRREQSENKAKKETTT